MTTIDPTQPDQQNFTIDSAKAAHAIGSLLSVLQQLNSQGQNPSGSADTLSSGTTQQPQQQAQAQAETTSPTAPTTSSDASEVSPVPEGTKIAQGYHGDTGGQAGVDPGTDHPGVDLSVPVGTQIVAAVSGTVTHAANDDPNGYGRWVEITAANGLRFRYGHLSGLAVNQGETVKAGQPIGLSGGLAGADGSGDSTGPHLHFEVDTGNGTTDPIPYLAGGHQVLGTVPVGATASVPTVTPESATDTTVNRLTHMLAGQGDPGSPNAAQPTASTASNASPATGSRSDNDPGAVDAFLSAIRTHESGGDYTIYNQSGMSNASGAYQFLGSTWKGLGGSTEAAAQASPAEQDAIARKYALDLFNQFHSWRLVAIAWYGGPGIAQQAAAGQNPGSPEGQGSYLAYGDTIERMMQGGK